MSIRGLCVAAPVLVSLSGMHAQARVTHLEMLGTEPAFGGDAFGNVGPYRHVFAAPVANSTPPISTTAHRHPMGFPPSLTVPADAQDPRVPIPNNQWSFGTCEPGQPVRPDPKHLCMHPASSRAGSMS